MKKIFNQIKNINTHSCEKSNIIWSWLGSFLGIFSIAYFHGNIIDDKDLVLVIGSFGASAVLVFGAIDSNLAQPRNLIGGHVISAIIGVCAYKLFLDNTIIAAAFAVSTAILLMQVTLTLHPPGGATALIAVLGSEQIHDLGFLYVLLPVLSGAIILFLIAILVNNISKYRTYPKTLKPKK